MGHPHHLAGNQKHHLRYLEPKQLVDHVRRDGAYLLLCDRPIGESTLTEVGQVLRVEVGAVVEGGEKEIEVGIHAHGRHGR